MKIDIGCTMVELIDAINEASEGSEPYHIELTGTSGTITQAQFDALAADDQSYITWKSSSSSTEKFVYARQRYNSTTSATDTTTLLNYASVYNVSTLTSIYIQKNLTWTRSTTMSLQQTAYKVSVITDSNKTSTTSYPSVKAVVDYVAAQGGGGTPTNMVTTDTSQTISGAKTFSKSTAFDAGISVGTDGIEVDNPNGSASTVIRNGYWVDGIDGAANVSIPCIAGILVSNVVMPAAADEGTKGFFLTSGGGGGNPSEWKGLSYYNVNFAIRRSSSITVYISWGVVAPSGYKTVKALIQGITGSTSSKLNIPTSVSNYTYSGTTYSLGYLSTNGTPSGTTAYNTNGSSFTPYYSSSSETIGSIAAEFQFFK